VACNTATAYGLEDLKAALHRWQIDVPLIGVVEAGARAVVTALPDDGQPQSIAVLATVGTCSSEAYPKAIRRATGQAGKRLPVVVQQGSVGLAGAIEGNRAFVWDAGSDRARPTEYQGPSHANLQAPLDDALWPAYGFAKEGLRGDQAAPQLNSVRNYARYDVILLLEAHRRQGGPAITAAVLGCTHFPLAQAELSEAFRTARAYAAPDGTHPYAATVAPNVALIDPGNSTARELVRELARTRLRRRGTNAPSASRFYFSVANPRAPGIQLAGDGSLAMNYKTRRIPGRMQIEDTIAIPLTSKNLPAESARLVARLPAVWRELQSAP
jgi:glutamate racemase